MKLPVFVFAVSLITRAASPLTTLATLPNSTVNAVTTDAAGNIYVAGGQVLAASHKAFVAKLSPAGQTLYSTTFTGSGFNGASAIAVDSSGAAYIFGETSSPDFPVTPGALQTTLQAARMQGFAAKVDPAGKVVYATFIGGSSDIGPAANGILVDSAGDAILSGGTATNGMPGSAAFPVTPGAPYTSTDSSTYFVMKLDPPGAKQLAAIRGIGGALALDSQGNIYVAGLQSGNAVTPVPITPGAFQSEPVNVCGALGNFFECAYQYVAKLNAGLTQIAYSTYIGGKYGESPVAISVDAQGDAFLAGTTSSPDYPTTPDAYEPQYIASAIPKVNCFFIINCVTLPPASGYLTELNPTGTGLIYSSYFSGSQTDTITFAAFTASGIYLSGSAGSADLPGFTGFPQQCLPETYATRLSADGTETGASRIAPGNVLAYDAFAGTLIASVIPGTASANIVAFDPAAPQPPVACILDSADLQPVTSIAPGELLSLFGEFSSGSASTPPAGQFPTSLGGVTVAVNGIPSPLLYAGPEQINFQAPFSIAAFANINGTTQANINFASTQPVLSDSRALPIMATNPVAFLNTPVPPPAIAPCIFHSAASLNGTFPLALNPDGSLNACLHPAAPGSIVTMFLDGLGVSLPTVASSGPATVVYVSPLPGAISGVWQVGIQIPANAPGGALQLSLSAGGVPVRDANLIVWVQ
jgi:uncharacterized protein (TIGR03437 family)